MSYKKTTILFLAVLSIVAMPCVLQASPNMKDWDDLVKEVRTSNPSLFADSSSKTKQSAKSEAKDSSKASSEKLDEKEEKAKKKKTLSRRQLTKKLYKAVKKDDYEKVKEYVLAGADTNYAKKNGLSLLHIAAAHGDLPIVRVLATHGADHNATTIKDWIPLHHAARFGHLEVVRYLVGKGSSLFQVNSDGKNAYTLARQMQHKEVVNYMDIWRKYH